MKHGFSCSVSVLLLIMVPCVLAFNGCTGGKRIVEKVSDTYRPNPPYEWYVKNKAPRDNSHLYFIGRTDFSAREDDAFNDAYNDALAQISQYIENQIRYAYARARVESGISLSPDQVGLAVNELKQVISSAVVRKAEVYESQVVYRNSPGNPYRDLVKVQSLVRIPKETLLSLERDALRQRSKEAGTLSQLKAEELLDWFRDFVFEEQESDDRR